MFRFLLHSLLHAVIHVIARGVASILLPELLAA